MSRVLGPQFEGYDDTPTLAELEADEHIPGPRLGDRSRLDPATWGNDPWNPPPMPGKRDGSK